MNSKMVIERDQAARAVVTGAAVHGATVAAKLAARLVGELRTGERMPDLGLAIRLVAGDVERHRQALVAADGAHQREVRGFSDLCRRRDAAVVTLRRTLSALRLAMDGAYGPGTSAATLRLEGPLAADPGSLLVQAQAVLSILDEPEALAMPSAQVVAGVSLDLPALREHLEGPTAVLGEALVAADMARRGKEATQAEKQRALAAHDAAFQAGSRLMEALFAAAGLSDLAACLRPRRRPRVETPVRPSPVRR